MEQGERRMYAPLHLGVEKEAVEVRERVKYFGVVLNPTLSHLVAAAGKAQRSTLFPD